MCLSVYFHCCININRWMVFAPPWTNSEREPFAEYLSFLCWQRHHCLEYLHIYLDTIHGYWFPTSALLLATCESRGLELDNSHRHHQHKDTRQGSGQILNSGVVISSHKIPSLPSCLTVTEVAGWFWSSKRQGETVTRRQAVPFYWS